MANQVSSDHCAGWTSTHRHDLLLTGKIHIIILWTNVCAQGHAASQWFSMFPFPTGLEFTAGYSTVSSALHGSLVTMSNSCSGMPRGKIGSAHWPSWSFMYQISHDQQMSRDARRLNRKPQSGSTSNFEPVRLHSLGHFSIPTTVESLKQGLAVRLVWLGGHTATLQWDTIGESLYTKWVGEYGINK